MSRNAIILIVIAALVLAVIGYRLATKEEVVAESIDDIQKREGVPVEVVTLKEQPFERWRTFSGIIEGKEQATLYANIAARVRKVYAKQGDKVYPGKTIIQLDPLSSAQTYSALNAARVQKEDAERMYQRMKPLYEAGAISKEEFDQIKSARKMARAGLVDTSSLITLSSPISGMLTDLRVNPGDRVDPMQTVATVADLTGAKIILDVSESDMQEIKPGQIVVLGRGAENRAEEKTVGTVSKLSLSADPQTYLFRVEVTVKEDADVRPNTLKYAQIRTFEADSALSVPLSALIKENGDNFVYVIKEDGTAERRKVTVGKSSDSGVMIEVGLNSGEMVVSWGASLLNGGEKVKIVTKDGQDVMPTKSES